MDHGTLTDNNGRHADFRNVILIMTTNAGAQEMSRASIGFTEQDHSSDGMEMIKKAFSPEFRNRLDSIIQFGSLTVETIRTVVDKFIVELQVQLDQKNVQLQLEDSAVEWFVTHGYSESMGARPMARLIQDKLKKGIAEDILFGKLVNGGKVIVSATEGDIVIEAHARESSQSSSRKSARDTLAKM
jgi:ATP-dependent Clp protease ATP-binding subunit ClpA